MFCLGHSCYNEGRFLCILDAISSDHVGATSFSTFLADWDAQTAQKKYRVASILLAVKKLYPPLLFPLRFARRPTC